MSQLKAIAIIASYFAPPHSRCQFNYCRRTNLFIYLFKELNVITRAKLLRNHIKININT